MNAVRPKGPTRNIFGRLARYGFVVGAVLAAGLVLSRDTEKFASALHQANLPSLPLAQLFGLFHVAVALFAWKVLLDGSHARLTLRSAARTFFLGQMGKYLPGGVWHFVALAELGRDTGLARKTMIASQMVALLICIGVGVTIALAAVPQALGLVSANRIYPVVIVIAPTLLLLCPPVRDTLFRWARIDFRPPLRALLACAGWMTIVWLMAGAQLVVLCDAIGVDVGWQMLPALTGIYAISWTAGFLFFLAPAGLGAREAVLVALLSVHMPMPQALIVAFLSRVAMTFADFLWAAIAGFMLPAPAVR